MTMPLLQPAPDKGRVRAIVLASDTNEDGTIDREEVRRLFSKLLGVSEIDIPLDHEEVVAFSGLGTDEMVDKLYAGTSKSQVDTYFNERFPNGTPISTSILRGPKPDHEKVKFILDATDLMGDGFLTSRFLSRTPPPCNFSTA